MQPKVKLRSIVQNGRRVKWPIKKKWSQSSQTICAAEKELADGQITVKQFLIQYGNDDEDDDLSLTALHELMQSAQERLLTQPQVSHTSSSIERIPTLMVHTDREGGKVAHEGPRIFLVARRMIRPEDRIRKLAAIGRTQVTKPHNLQWLLQGAPAEEQSGEFIDRVGVLHTDAVLANQWLQSHRKLFKADVHRPLFLQVEKCVENYVKVKLMKGTKVVVAKDAMPTKFSCQPDRQKVCAPRRLASKRAHQELLDDAFSSCSGAQDENVTTEEHSFELENPKVVANCVYTQTPIILTKAAKTQTSLSLETELKSETPEKGTRTIGIGRTPVKENPYKKEYGQQIVDEEVHDGVIDNEYKPGDEPADECDAQFLVEELKIISQSRAGLLFKMKPLAYLGLPESALFIIDLLKEEEKSLSDNDIYVVFLKIRTGHTFAEIGDVIGLSGAHVSRLFKDALPLIHNKIRQLIYWPPKEHIAGNLPIAFRANYSKVACIIDAFEIEIQQPSNPVHQAGTWSNYKKCNTMKYLIAITPNGLVSWVSKGFGGRTSDTKMLSSSNFFEVIPQESDVMADRGFKEIEGLLAQKGCRLVRPPSVNTTDGQSMTKEQVMETKAIASLRIHVERAIRRVREMKLLSMHSCVDLKFLPQLDMAVNVACGLLNLQGELIR